MDTDTKLKYAIAGSAAFLVVLVIVYFIVASYYHIPVSSLLPVSQIKKSIPTSVPPAHSAAGSVQRFTMGNGSPVYVVKGKFVTKPTYNPDEILQGEFVIDGDPQATRILVVLSPKDGKMTVNRSRGSFEGETKTGPEDTESLNNSIVVDAPVQLRFYAGIAIEPFQAAAEKKVMEDIIAGNWTIPEGLVLHPSLVGLVQ